MASFLNSRFTTKVGMLYRPVYCCTVMKHKRAGDIRNRMKSKSHEILAIFSTVMLLIAGCSDNVEVPPGDGNIDGIEYVSVRHEPQHRHEFENERVRIYDVLLPPGHVTLYHAHILDTAYVAIHGSKMKTKSLVGSFIPIALPIPSGMVLYSEHKNNPLIHEVTNVGDNIARLVGVELKHESAQFVRKPIAGHGLELKDTYAKVRVYELNLAPGESTGKLEFGFTGLIIALTEASVSSETTSTASRIASFEPASWEWLDDPGHVNLTNIDHSSFEAVLYEFP
jgi:hypothetical protein